jgi:hypothetical protein
MTKDELKQRLANAENNPDRLGRAEAKVQVLAEWALEHKVTPR